jgi:hypothetical protein
MQLRRVGDSSPPLRGGTHAAPPRFGEEAIMTRQLCTLALAAALLPHAASAQVENHLSCWAIKDSAPQQRYQTTVATPAGTETCTVRTPARIACAASAVSGITPTPPGGGPTGTTNGSFLCYPAKCSKPTANVNVEDEFGRRLIRFRVSRFVCSPAAVNAPAPGPGGTTTTTLAGGNGECRFTDGKCKGSCAGMGGGFCRAVVGSASCECTNVACGDADSPSCNGGCSNPDEACVFDLTGCSCVNIP